MKQYILLVVFFSCFYLNSIGDPDVSVKIPFTWVIKGSLGLRLIQPLKGTVDYGNERLPSRRFRTTVVHLRIMTT